jgi:hypothetical protein
MQRYIIIVCILCLSMTFVSCSKPKYLENESENLETENQSLEDTLGEDTEDEFAFLKEGNSGYATNYKGLFYVEIPTNQIKYYDYSSGETEVWCTNLTCNHNSKECSAYVEEDYRYVKWYDNHVYKIDYDDKGEYLVQYKEDGTGEIRLANLLGDYLTGAKVDIGRTYKGRLYYFVKKDDNTIDVNRVSLSAKDNIENLFNIDVTDTKVSASGMYVNDNCIYISMAKYEAGDSKKFSRQIYRYDFTSNELKLLDGLNNISRSCANESLYYLTDENRLYRVNNDGISNEIASGLADELKYNDYNIYCNSDYIVFSRDALAAMRNENVDIYIYNIKNDTLSCISDGSEEEADGEISYVEIQGGVQIQGGGKRNFWGVIGLSGEYVFISGKNLKCMYAIRLEDGSVTKLPFEINVSK